MKTTYYNKFKYGEKKIERRKLGARWNTKTCYAGRPIILSKGYGKKDRMIGIILSVGIHPLETMQHQLKDEIVEIYGDGEYDLICFKILVTSFKYKEGDEIPPYGATNE